MAKKSTPGDGVHGRGVKGVLDVSGRQSLRSVVRSFWRGWVALRRS